MIADNHQFTRAGGDAYPLEPEVVDGQNEVILIGAIPAAASTTGVVDGPAKPGTVVIAAYDQADSLFNEDLVAGQQEVNGVTSYSSMRAVQIPNATDEVSPGVTAQSLFERVGLFGVLRHYGRGATDRLRGVARNAFGFVATGYKTVPVRVLMPAAGGLHPNEGLMYDWADGTGRLTQRDGTGKCIGLVARRVDGGAGIDGTEQVVFVRLNGTYGFGL